MKKPLLVLFAIIALMVNAVSAKNVLQGIQHLNHSIKATTTAEVKMMEETLSNLEDEDDDDDEYPEFFITGWIEDAGLSMRLSFNGVSDGGLYWIEGTMIATFDSYDEEALCVGCTVEGRSNLPGEEYILEDLTEDYAGLSKPTIRWIFQMILDEEIESIQQVTSDNGITRIYNLQGQPLMQLQPGINIIGSNKVIIK